MKYIVGASIGGLFGFSMPLVMDIQQLDNDKSPRVEEFQPVEEGTPVIIDNALVLPDNICGYIVYESDDIKEQAKECLRQSLPAIPAI
tara:strand:+ start:1273 stop:1536 length:264 start_codon:yes stop_codon:yes gene_type:complete